MVVIGAFLGIRDKIRGGNKLFKMRNATSNLQSLNQMFLGVLLFPGTSLCMHYLSYDTMNDRH